MTLSLWVTIGVIVLMSVGVITYVFTHRKKITCMSGMMISMTLGMMVGIILGTIIGIYVKDLFLATIYASFIGILIGVIAGAPIGLMASIDGLVSGLMGGMMGAMLGDMIILDRADTLIKILLVIFVIVALILFYFMINEINPGNGPSLFKNPFIIAMVVVLFFFIYNQLGEITFGDEQEMENKMEHQHSIE